MYFGKGIVSKMVLGLNLIFHLCLHLFHRNFPRCLSYCLEGCHLQTFIALLLTNPVSPLQEKAVFLKPTPKSLPSPASLRKTFTALQSTFDEDYSESERARSQLRDNFCEIQFSSKPFCDIHNSEFMGQHIVTEVLIAWAPEVC